jgi:hypothetical protein
MGRRERNLVERREGDNGTKRIKGTRHVKVTSCWLYTGVLHCNPLIGRNSNTASRNEEVPTWRNSALSVWEEAAKTRSRVVINWILGDNALKIRTIVHAESSTRRRSSWMHTWLPVWAADRRSAVRIHLGQTFLINITFLKSARGILRYILTPGYATCHILMYC